MSKIEWNEGDDYENEEDDEAVSISYDIASYPSDHTLAGIAQMWADEDISIPNYQREFVWSIKQSSLLIDSFLCGLPVPPVFFYIDEENRNVVIDGQQRILTIVFYIEGYFGKENTQGKRQVFRLSGLNEKSPFYNKRFADLDETYQRKLKQSVLRAVNIRQLSPVGEGTSAYHIFERLNTGGTPLKPQEIRNCVFMGGLSDRLREANENKNWRAILGKKYIDKHQKDVELLLRIFSLVSGSDKYEKPMREFLNKSMKQHQSGFTQKAERFFEAFPLVTTKVMESLGEKPFRLRGPINVSALDSIMCVLIENHRSLKKIDLKAGYDELVSNKNFVHLTSVNTTDVKSVQDRIDLVREVLIG